MIIIILSTMGTHQGDPFCRHLFALAYFVLFVLLQPNFFLVYSPWFIVHNTHIICPPSLVFATFEFLTKKSCLRLAIRSNFINIQLGPHPTYLMISPHQFC